MYPTTIIIISHQHPYPEQESTKASPSFSWPPLSERGESFSIFREATIGKTGAAECECELAELEHTATLLLLPSPPPPPPPLLRAQPPIAVAT
ncbi:hypothetical protein E2C01_033260 [Portunus trituberculatus]|uniref:Uncharacterized protein n=1 Tax=Portunus trituberculatus TaxID=210409 RepID=A0A5B7F3Q2_PORTR|nr:hypothetical protein [Portunus trituberculatus]